MNEEFISFFRNATIPDECIELYVSKFIENDIQISDIHLLSESQLEKMGVTKIGHQTRIREQAKRKNLEQNIQATTGASTSSEIEDANVSANVSYHIAEGDPKEKRKKVALETPEVNMSVSDFAVLRNLNTYLDKSLIILSMIQKKSSLLVTAPRRFGKSSILSTIRYFFELEHVNGFPVSCDIKSPIKDTSNYELFNGLEIAKPKYKAIIDKHFGKYPILFLNCKCKQINEIKDAKDDFQRIIRETFEEHEYLLKSSELSNNDKKFCEKWIAGSDKKFLDENYHLSLKYLSCYLCKHFHSKCMVLIDEYDNLCSKAMLSLKKSEDVKSVIEYFMTALSFLLKDNDTNIQQGFLTGISYICTAGLSMLGNVSSFRFLRNRDFVSFYGISEAEMKLLKRFIKDEDLVNIRENYNGYEFEGQVFYSIWSIMKFFETNELKNHWVESGFFFGISKALKIGKVKFYIEHLLQSKENTVKISSISKLYPEDVVILKNRIEEPNFDIQNVDNLFNFYLEQGYLTIRKETRNEIHISIPNIEIHNEFKRLLIEYYTDTWKIDLSLVEQCGLCLNQLFSDIPKYLNKFCNLIQQILIKMENDQPFNEAVLHHVVYFCALNSNYKCFTEAYLLNRKRLDIAMISKLLGIIFEFKFNKSCSAALTQIIKKNYFSIFSLQKCSVQDYILIAMNLKTDSNDIELEVSYLHNSLKLKDEMKIETTE